MIWSPKRFRVNWQHKWVINARIHNRYRDSKLTQLTSLSNALSVLTNCRASASEMKYTGWGSSVTMTVERQLLPYLAYSVEHRKVRVGRVVHIPVQTFEV